MILPPIHFSTINEGNLISSTQKKAHCNSIDNTPKLSPSTRKRSPKHQATCKYRNSSGNSADSAILMLKGERREGTFFFFSFSSENKKSITMSWPKRKKLSVWWWRTNSFSRRSGVSLGVPRVLTSLWKVETAVLIWNIPAATACVGSCLPLAKPRREPKGRPASMSWKLIIPFHFLEKIGGIFRRKGGKRRRWRLPGSGKMQRGEFEELGQCKKREKTKGRFWFGEVVSSVGLYGCNSLPLRWRGPALRDTWRASIGWSEASILVASWWINNS